VLAEEEYTKNNGDVGKRLYVASVHSVDAIKKGEFKVPELKRLAGAAPAATQQGSFENLPDEGDLPF
jgi:hypothetical protein